MKHALLLVITFSIFACSQNTSEKAEMYEYSELASLMREMVAFSEEAKAKLIKGDSITSIPASIWGLKEAKGTRDEHLESTFQSLTDPYLNALKGIERGDSQLYFYNQSIDACKSCHSSYCGGPLVVINKLPIHSK